MSSSYDQPRVLSLHLGLIDFGAGAAVTRDVPLPLGVRQMRVLDIHVHVTEAFADDTQTAAVQVGRAGDLDEFAELLLPDGLTVGTIRGFRDAGGGLNSIYVAEAGNTAVMDKVRITCLNGTDSSAVTGQGEVTVFVEVDYVRADL